MLKRIGALLLLLLAGQGQASAQAHPDPKPAISLVAEDGAWCWFSDPRAVYYKKKQERIYFGFINSRGDVVISARDFKTKAVESFVLHEKLQVDDHNVPSILFLPDGRLVTFYTEHNGRSFLRRSKHPEDISSWEDEKILPFGNRITYSHPLMLSGENNRIYLFWRGSDWRPTFSYSDTGGDSWAAAQALIDGRGQENSHRPYLKVTTDHKNRIDFAFTDGHPGAEPTNSIYHMYYQQGNFFQTNGRPLGTVQALPLQLSAIDRVYDARPSGIRAWIADIALDRRNRPVLVYARFPATTDHRYHYAAWDGKKWADQELCRAGGWMPNTPPGKKETELFYSGGIALDHATPGRLFLSRPVAGTLELEQWTRKGKSWETRALTTHSARNNIRPYAVEHYKGKVPLVLWMQGVYVHYTQFDTSLLLNR